MAHLSVCAFIIPDGVDTTLGVSSSVYQLTTMVTNYLTLVLVDSSLTRWTEDGQSSLVGSVENSTCSCMLYAGLPALHDLSTGSTYRLFPSDSSFYQFVLCGCTRSTYRAYLPPSYLTRLCGYAGTNLCAKRHVTCDLTFPLSVFKPR